MIVDPKLPVGAQRNWTCSRFEVFSILSKQKIRPVKAEVVKFVDDAKRTVVGVRTMSIFPIRFLYRHSLAVVVVRNSSNFCPQPSLWQLEKVFFGIWDPPIDDFRFL